MPHESKIWQIAIIGFDHMHAGDFLRAIIEHPRAAAAGLWDSDPARVDIVADDFDIPAEIRFADVDELIESGRPDIAVVCSTTREHAEWVDYLAGKGVNIILEKPFATSLEDADRMIEAATTADVLLAVNWPLAWYPPHRTTQRLINEGLIGRVREVHYYDGNRGPLNHVHDKREAEGALDPEARRTTWWYQKERGGGSLLDYLGYGATLSTWFRGGELPSEITARTHVAPGDEVDEQSVVIASYPGGLSTLQTRWGTFTDPWTHQPQPRCGFVVVGTEGTISSFDYAGSVTVQTHEHPEGRDIPVDVLDLADTNGVAHVIAGLESGGILTGPMSWSISRAGQRIVDSSIASAESGAPVILETADAAKTGAQ